MHDEEMVKVEQKANDICELSKKLVKSLDGGKYEVDSVEGGQIVDMIKDLADAEMNYWKSLYYQTVINSMKENEHKERYNDMPMGYDNWRYSSSGHFAPKGHGSYSPMGYSPEIWGQGKYPWYQEELMDEYPMGYSGSGRSSSGGGSSSSGRSGGNSSRGGNSSSSGNYGNSGSSSRYGYPFDMYREAKRYFTETRSEDDKREMDSRGKEHVMNAIDTMKEIWEDADPAFKKQMKTDLTKLLGDMNG